MMPRNVKVKPVRRKAVPLAGYLMPVPLRQHERARGNLNAVQMTSAGMRAGFAHSWLQARGFFIDNSAPRENLFEDPRPLLTWPFLDFVSTLELSEVDLVELGAGSSTIFFSKKFRSLRSFENDHAWARALEARLASNVSLHRFSGERLDPALVAVEADEWLLIDFAGKRTRFIKELLEHQKSAALPAVVILDNADWYRNGAELLRDAGYTELPFFGLKSGQTWASCTSFFFLPSRLRLEFAQPFRLPVFSRPRTHPWDSVK